MKNLVLAARDKRIVFLSETVEGSHSEKRLADEQRLAFVYSLMRQIGVMILTHANL